jgi:hypothetical protein
MNSKNSLVVYVSYPKEIKLRPIDILNRLAPHGIAVNSVGIVGGDLAITIDKHQATERD